LLCGAAGEHTPRARAGGHGIAQHGRARDPDVGDAVRRAGRLLERGTVGHVRREEHEVGDHAGPDEAAVGEADRLRREEGVPIATALVRAGAATEHAVAAALAAAGGVAAAWLVPLWVGTAISVSHWHRLMLFRSWI
jgi:hypothetical protein